jgi:hypothetical protein
MTPQPAAMSLARPARTPPRFEVLRWLLVVPVGVVAFLLSLFVTMVLHEIPEHFCPVDKMVSGSCFAGWATLWHEASVVVGGVVCAALMVALPALTAPRWRSAVGALAFLAGFVMVSGMTQFGGVDPVLFIAATSSGLAALVLVHVRSLAP